MDFNSNVINRIINSGNLLYQTEMDAVRKKSFLFFWC